MNKILQKKIILFGNKYNFLIVLLFCVALVFYTNRVSATTNKRLTIPEQLQQTKISLTIQNKSLKYILNEIQKKSGIGFSFKDEGELNAINNLSINVTNVTIEEALDQLLAKSGFTYKIVKNTINIVKKSVPAVPQKTTQAKEKFSGRVVDSSKSPIVGATVLLKDSNAGAITDQKGEFSINASIGDLLEISFVGKESQSIKILTNQYLIFELKDELMSVDDVVVTGIFTRKAESFTGSAVTITSKELLRVGNQNVFQSLKNLDPSLYIMENMDMGSDPNTMPDMKLRGTSTLSMDESSSLKSNYQNKPNQPLFILDGFEVSASKVFDMDMYLIESITILKDASAKALYGSKAANGVVVIETLRLAGIKTRISYNGSVDVTMPDLSSYDLCNSIEKLDLEYREGVYFDTPQDLKKYNTLRKQALDGLSTYWLSKPIRTGIGTKHNASVEMNKDELKVLLNFNYNNIKGVMKGSERTTIQGAANISYRFKSLLFKNNMSFASNQSLDSPFGNFSTYSKLNPYFRLFDEYGAVIRQYKTVETYDNLRENPYLDGILNTKFSSSYKEFINNTYLELSIVEGLKVSARLGIVSNQSDADKFYPAEHSKFARYKDEDTSRKGSYEVTNGKSNTLSGDAYLNYSKSFGKHAVFANAGFNLSEKSYRDVVNSAEGFPSDKMNDIMFALQYQKDTRPNGISSISREVGVLGVISYSFDNRFLADFTLRSNASSMFGDNNKWATFWSTGIGWNLHNEKFMKEVKWITQMKVRASIGSTGNQNFNNNKSIATYQYYMKNRYDDMLGSTLKNMKNSDLKWEQKMDYNVGLDANVLGFTVRFDWYNAVTQNLVTNVSIAPSSGFMTVGDNIGKVQNTGFELTIAKTIINSEKGYLNFSASAVTNKNKIIEISDALKTFNKEQSELAANAGTDRPVAKYMDGLDMNAIWAVPSCGIDPATGLELYRGIDGNQTYIWKATDMRVVGTTEPKFRGNFGFNGEYKGIGINVTCTFLAGGQMYNQTLVDKVENAAIGNNMDRRALTERWSGVDQKAYFRRNDIATPYDMRSGVYGNSAQGYKAGATRATSRFVQDRNELNISSLSLYYDINRRFVRKIGLERLKFAAYMNDVAKFSSIKVERGTTYPFARTVSFSLSGTF